MAVYDIDEIDEELQRRIDAEVETRVQARVQDAERTIATLSDPEACPFALIERCGRKSYADISICVNCHTARSFIDRSPTFNDFNDARIAQAVKRGLTTNGVSDMVAAFLRLIVEQCTSTVVVRDIEEIPTNELQTMKALTEIAGKLENEGDETYSSGITAMINDITQAICQ